MTRVDVCLQSCSFPEGWFLLVHVHDVIEARKELLVQSFLSRNKAQSIDARSWRLGVLRVKLDFNVLDLLVSVQS